MLNHIQFVKSTARKLIIWKFYGVRSWGQKSKLGRKVGSLQDFQSGVLLAMVSIANNEASQQQTNK